MLEMADGGGVADSPIKAGLELSAAREESEGVDGVRFISWVSGLVYWASDSAG